MRFVFRHHAEIAKESSSVYERRGRAARRRREKSNVETTPDVAQMGNV
jgi:hypothetical protein